MLLYIYFYQGVKLFFFLYFYFSPSLEYRLSVWPGWPIECSIRDSMAILSVGLESRVTSPLFIEIFLSCHVNKFQLACWRMRKKRERDILPALLILLGHFPADHTVELRYRSEPTKTRTAQVRPAQLPVRDSWVKPPRFAVLCNKTKANWYSWSISSWWKNKVRGLPHRRSKCIPVIYEISLIDTTQL